MHNKFSPGLFRFLGVLLLSAPTVCLAQEPVHAETTQLIAFVKKAAALVESKGVRACGDFKKQGSQWFREDIYVFVFDLKGLSVCHPANPELEGQSILDYQDPTGKFVTHDMIDMLKSREAGWIDYMWPKPGETKPSRKSSYIMRGRLDGKTLIIGSGFYVN